jgi:hypothetical protein
MNFQAAHISTDLPSQLPSANESGVIINSNIECISNPYRKSVLSIRESAASAFLHAL